MVHRSDGSAETPAPLTVSIVVPVLNEAPRIPALLRRLTCDFPGCELIVVDGGSVDGTPDLIHPPARLVRSGAGRGPQLADGAARAIGDVLWVHHVDTVVDPVALGQLRAALADPAVVGGGLALRFDRGGPALWWIAATSNVRARRLGWIFGDQAMFVRRSALDRVGGFPRIPLMEDLELSRRLSRIGRLAVLPATSTASARRFTEHGALRVLIFMQSLKLRYLAGTDPAVLARDYAEGPRRWRPFRQRGRPGGHGDDRTGTPARHRGTAGPAELERAAHHDPAGPRRRMAVRLLRGPAVLQRRRSAR
jgi:rSAM/selenodomain-associated transferase 2